MSKVAPPLRRSSSPLSQARLVCYRDRNVDKTLNFLTQWKKKFIMVGHVDYSIPDDSPGLMNAKSGVALALLPLRQWHITRPEILSFLC